MPLQVRKCFEHKRIWWNDESFGSKFNGSLWEPQLNVGEFFFYHIADAGHQAHKKFSLVGWGGVKDAFALPLKFDLVWNDKGANTKMFSSKSPIRRSIWQPVAQEGYACLGMLGLGADWHDINQGKRPTARDFPRFRCVKLQYLERMKPTYLSYEWRWNSSGSTAKLEVSLYNVLFKQPGLNDTVRIALGVPMLDNVEVPGNEIFCLNPIHVSFDADLEVDEIKEVSLVQYVEKAKPVYIDDFWHCQHHTWRYHHFILFSDRRLEYYIDTTDENTYRARYNSLVCLELRGSYDLSAVAILKTVKNQKLEKKYLKLRDSLKNQLQVQSCCRKRSMVAPNSGSQNSISFQTIKSLFGFETEPTPYIIELEHLHKKRVKFAFESESLMKDWFKQLKLFSIIVNKELRFSRPEKNLPKSMGSHLSLQLLKTSHFHEDEIKYSEGQSIDNFSNIQLQKELVNSKMPPTKFAKWSFWITVIETGMKFSVSENTGVDICWNLYAGKDKDRILKSELARILSDWMQTRLDAFPESVIRTQGFDFLDNIGERALQAKKFLNTSKSGRVIFQEFQKIRTPSFWQLMDEKKQVIWVREARRMWERILDLLADYGFLGDDEVIEIWERYDTDETGTLSLNNVKEFLRDWIWAISKIYPNAIRKKTIENFLDTLECRAQLASRLLDPTSEGLSFNRFRQIQSSSFWKHIDSMVSVQIKSPLSFSEVESINRSISFTSPKKLTFSWNSFSSQKEIIGGDMIFPALDRTDVSESASYLRDPGAALSDADLPEDPMLNIKLNSCKR